MKKMILILMIILIVGCSNPIEDPVPVKTPTEEPIKVTTPVEQPKEPLDDGRETTIVEEVAPTTNEWCPTGGQWSMSSIGAEGSMEGEWKIDKIMSTGKYKGLCHVLYSIDSPQGMMNMEYYFAEGGESGYVIANINGQQIEQAWP